MNDVGLVDTGPKVMKIELPVEARVEQLVAISNCVLLNHDLFGTVAGRNVCWWCVPDRRCRLACVNNARIEACIAVDKVTANGGEHLLAFLS